MTLRDPESLYDNGDEAGAAVRGGRRLEVTAAVLAMLATVLIVGWAARPGHHRARAGATEQQTTVPSAPPATATSMTPTAGSATGQGGSLRPNTVGVLVGYRHDQAGAVAAAGNYTAALYVHTNRTRSRESAVLASIATSGVDAARITGDASSEDAALAAQLGVADLQDPTVIAYGHPIGYRVETATVDAVTVDVYVAGGQGLAGVAAGSAAAGRAFFEVDQVQLAWQPPGPGGDWRLRNWSHLVQDNSPDLGTVAAAGYAPFPIGQDRPAIPGGGR